MFEKPYQSSDRMRLKRIGGYNLCTCSCDRFYLRGSHLERQGRTELFSFGKFRSSRYTFAYSTYYNELKVDDVIGFFSHFLLQLGRWWAVIDMAKRNSFGCLFLKIVRIYFRAFSPWKTRTQDLTERWNLQNKQIFPS